MLKYPLLITAGFLIGALAIENKHYFDRKVPVPVALLPDGGQYDGELKQGLFHGKGRITWPDGNYYEGNFRRGLFDGQGRLEYGNNVVYKGEFQQGRATGKGKIDYADGAFYKGEVQNGLPHGHGTLKSTDSTYTGSFKNGHFYGHGVLVTAAGASYNGQFKDGLYHGKGLYMAENGGRYTGNFTEGQFVGQGSFEQGKIRYEGDFVDWLFDGNGIYYDGLGGRYVGQFVDHQLKGKGEYFAPNGAYYKGEFANFQYHGKGHLTTPDGDQYWGDFHLGRYHGNGQLRYAKILDGTKQVTGRWHHGALVESNERNHIIDPQAVIERVLYNQKHLLNDNWRQLVENDPDKVDLYFLGIAGDGSQAVFRREVLAVKDYFDSYYDTEGKSTVLINSSSTYETYPLATNTSIELTLNAIADRMDKDNDILFVYMTSHGSEDFEFYLHQQSAQFNDLSASQLNDMLDSLPIRWKVIFISACYSGGFIPALKNNDTLIITAAAEDKASFGCSDRSERTYFGEAFFEDALPMSSSFVDAFDKAKSIVAGREAKEGYEHSNPQIHKPTAIVEQLSLWREQLR